MWITALAPLLLAASAAAQDTTPPAAVALASDAATRSTLRLLWTAPGDDGNAGTAAAYDLRLSVIGPIDTPAKFAAAPTVGGLGAPQPAGSAESVTLTGLSAATTYYFALRSADEVPNASALSNALSAVTLATSAPRAVPGLRGARDEPAGDFLLSWSPVSRYADGTPVDADFVRYAVERAPSLDGPFVLLAAVSTNSFAYRDAGGLAAPAVYRVRAADAFGGSSTARAFLDNAAAALLFPSPDGLARLQVPAAAQAPLFAAGNAAAADLYAAWTKAPAEETGKVLLAYELAFARETDDAAFPVALPQPGGQLHFRPPAGAPLSRLAVFQFNGVGFSKLGGQLAAAEFAVGIEAPGRYRLQESARAADLTVTMAVPPKVFTPNGDGINDTIAVFFDNPANESISGEVFDLRGARVAAMRAGAGDSLVWDGLDESGRSAPTGVYLYRLRGGSGSASGTIVVAH